MDSYAIRFVTVGNRASRAESRSTRTEARTALKSAAHADRGPRRVRQIVLNCTMYRNEWHASSRRAASQANEFAWIYPYFAEFRRLPMTLHGSMWIHISTPMWILNNFFHSIRIRMDLSGLPSACPARGGAIRTDSYAIRYVTMSRAPSGSRRTDASTALKS
jgi:hypothetical protein